MINDSIISFAEHYKMFHLRIKVTNHLKISITRLNSQCNAFIRINIQIHGTNVAKIYQTKTFRIKCFEGKQA